MNANELDRQLSILSDELRPAATFLRAFSEHLSPPVWYQSASGLVGFRYTSPDARHFCLLKATRAISGINACIHLAHGGFTQEIAVIIRTVVECASLIEWVRLQSRSDGFVLADPQRTYVNLYFEDYRRDRPGDSLKLGVRQGDVHHDVGDWLDERAREIGTEMNEGEARRRMSNVYQAHSNYVHARYPEVMDMFGGRPGRFHVDGMSGTPKDDENIAVIRAYGTTVNLAVVGMARHFKPPFLQSDPVLGSWLALS